MGARTERRGKAGKGRAGWREREGLGGSWRSSVLAVAAVAFVAYGLSRAARGSSAWAFAMVAVAALAAPLVAIAVVNAPRLLRERAAARELPLEGVAFEGRSIPVEEFEGDLWACAQSVANILGEPAGWAEGFRRAGPGMARRDRERLWIRREAWMWRVEAERGMDLRRIVRRIEADGFAPLRKARIKRESQAALGANEGAPMAEEIGNRSGPKV